jgi:hypothetical protein
MAGETEEPEDFDFEGGVPSQLVYYTDEEAEELVHIAFQELEAARRAWEVSRADAGKLLSKDAGVFLVSAEEQRILNAVALQYTSAFSSWTGAMNKFDAALHEGASYIGVYESSLQWSREGQERAAAVRTLVKEHLVETDNARRAEAAKVRIWFEGQAALGVQFSSPPWFGPAQWDSRPERSQAELDGWARSVLEVPSEEFLPRDLDGNIQR